MNTKTTRFKLRSKPRCLSYKDLIESLLSDHQETRMEPSVTSKPCAGDTTYDDTWSALVTSVSTSQQAR